MSAAAVSPSFSPTTGSGAGSWGGQARRRHLQVVPPMSAATASAGASSVRLTVKGRRVLAGLIVIVAMLAALATTAIAGSGAAAPERIEVQAGQTLSDVARTYLPELPVGTAIAQIQVANGLNSLEVSQGQALVIPAG